MFMDDPDLLVQMSVRDILDAVGEDPDREGLQGTPDRVARMYRELLGGYDKDPETVINGALFDVEYDEMVVVKDIEFYSLCEHHMLPFFGHAHVAYLPGERVVGLSKIPRIVEMFARRLQVQERMTRQIAELLDDVLEPHGVAVVVEGAHMCSMMRGVKKADSSMVTSAMLGSFRENHLTRAEFMQHLGRGPAGGASI
jgi:GTP cyclohydrolase I